MVVTTTPGLGNTAIVLLPKGAVALLAKGALLIIHLTCGCSQLLALGATEGKRLIRSAQENVVAVLGGIVNKHPLVVGLLLIEDADRLVLVNTRHPHDGTPAEGLVGAVAGAEWRVRLTCEIRRSRVSTGRVLVIATVIVRSQAKGVGECTGALTGGAL